MGKIVGAFAMSHVLGAPEGQEAQAQRVWNGMQEIGRQLRATRPDLIVVVTSDHLNNFRLSVPQPLAVGTADRYVPYGDMGLPKETFAGHREFAVNFSAFSRVRGIALEQIDELRPDHGVVIPLDVVDPKHEIPAVPLYVNTVFDPGPTPPQSWALGQALAAFIAESRPPAERVALLACGGLSHWLGVPDEGTVNEAWDRAFLGLLASGRSSRLAAFTNEQILLEAGNGGLEVNAWIAVAGAVPAASASCIFYEPIRTWASGMAGIAFQVGGAQ